MFRPERLILFWLKLLVKRIKVSTMYSKVIILICMWLSLFTMQVVFAQDVVKAKRAPVIDGLLNDKVWDQAQWHNLDKHILGEIPEADDFQGRYKLLWDKRKVYLLAEITDDVLNDTHADPLDSYWDDDCLEIFVDEDNSGGNHQFNYNAFAYHIALDNQAVDIGPFKSKEHEKNGQVNFLTLNDHVTSVWKRSMQDSNKLIWEVALSLYPDTFKESYQRGERRAKPVRLKPGKKIGFMLAYCDADGDKGREHFMGSHEIKPVNGDKNLGYITADVFGEIVLVKR